MRENWDHRIIHVVEYESQNIKDRKAGAKSARVDIRIWASDIPSFTHGSGVSADLFDRIRQRYTHIAASRETDLWLKHIGDEFDSFVGEGSVSRPQVLCKHDET